MILTSPLLSQFAWLEHGFGTRLAQVDQAAMASLKQIHSDRVLIAAESGPAGEGDALIAGAGVPVSVRTADCFPLLIADKRTRSVSAVHAGWRGTAAEIVRKAVAALRTEFDTRPEDIYAVIGPGIGACCYEVGEDVARQFGRKGAGYLDLATINRRQLLLEGVPGEQIDAVGGCTHCERELFHSFRRDKDRAGRMVSYIGSKNT
jgi:YfiH family protein